MIARIAAVVALAVAGTGCAFIAQGQVKKYDRQVQTYEKLQVDAEALGRGDTGSTADAVHEMSDWAGYIGTKDMPPVDRQRLVDRMNAARRRYTLDAARAANTPDLGYALAQGVLKEVEDDAEALATALTTVRELSDARAPRRQKLFATDHSYRVVKPGDTSMKTTDQGMSVENGQVVEQHTSSSLVQTPGNCVFATRPFGPEGTMNPGLTFRVVGEDPKVYVRCYLTRDIGALPTRDAVLYAIVPTGIADSHVTMIPLPASWPETKKHVDFILTRDKDGEVVDARLRFAHLPVELKYEYTSDIVMVPEDGAWRARKERAIVDLAESPLFWDRDGDPPGEHAAIPAAAPERAATAEAPVRHKRH